MATVAPSTSTNLCYICGCPAFCEQDKKGAIKVIVFDVASGVDIHLCSSKCFRVYRTYIAYVQLCSEAFKKDGNDESVDHSFLTKINAYCQKKTESPKTKIIFQPIEKRKNPIKDKVKKAPSPAESKEEKKN
jgi:hypothetical protein